MTVKYFIEFKEMPPTINQIISKLEENTGLNLELLYNNHAILCPRLKEGVAFYVKENTLIIEVGYRKINYLLGVTLNTLKNMGGKHEYDEYIPKVSKFKYGEIDKPNRFLYKVKKLKDRIFF